MIKASPTRRTLLAAAAATMMAGAIRPARAEAPKIRIGYWPIAGGLPFYTAVEKGFFKQAGLDVEAVKFASATQVVEAMIAGRLEGSANGTASAALGLGEITSPGLFKIFCSNPSNKTFVLDEILVAQDSTIQTIAELKGKRVACGPGIQNITLAKTILEANGIADPKVIELPIGQHVPALAAGQIDAVYTLEPTGTIGRLKGVTRVLETGVISKYVLGDETLPWFGGSATLTTVFMSSNPDAVKSYVSAYAAGVAAVAEHPDEVRQYLNGYTGIEPDLAREVPLPGFKMTTDFTASDTAAFQKFFDVFSSRGVFSRPIDVASLFYKG